MLEYTCSECGETKKSRIPGTITCSDRCRKRRSRRLAKERQLAEADAGYYYNDSTSQWEGG